jgi:hypothetical protein
MTDLRRPGVFRLAALLAVAAVPAGSHLGFAVDADTWWHLRVGQLVRDTGQLPELDPFSRLGREQPRTWLAYSWLYEWGLWQTNSAGGTAGLLWARAALGCLSAAAVFAVVFPRSGWTTGTHLTAWLVAFTLFPLMSERPWHVTIAGTAVTLLAVSALRDGRPVKRFVWLPLVFALWANLHIQFVLGWLVLGLACVFPGRADRTSLVTLTAACVAATLANPYHARLFGVVWEYATQTGPLRTVRELAPPDFTQPWTWAGLALVGWAVVVTLRRRPIDWFAVLLLLVGLVLMLRMRRDVWFAGLAAAAVLRPHWTGPSPGFPRWVVVAAVAGMFLAVRLTGLGQEHGDRQTQAATEAAFPVRAAEVVRERRLPGPLFNPFDWGGYLIWALPEHPVSIDGRTNLYGTDRVTRSMATWRGEPGWEADPDLTTARLVIAPADRPLTELLRGSNEWRMEYEDETAVVFVRR